MLFDVIRVHLKGFCACTGHPLLAALIDGLN